MFMTERGQLILSGKTHLLVGTATTLFVMQPTKFSEVAMCIGGGIVGSLICDIDVSSSKAHRLVNKIAIGIACIITLCLALESIFGISIFGDRSRVAVVIGAAVFIGVCIYGKDQPHRALMHSFTALILLSASLYCVIPTVVPYFAIAMASHMLIDLLNYINVRLFFPLKWGLSFDICYADSEGNKAIGAIGLVVTVAETVYFLGKIILNILA